MLKKAGIVVCTATFVLACAGPDGEDSTSVAEALQALRPGDAKQTSPAARVALQRASSRLCDLQADSFGDHAHNGAADEDPADGGWDWMLAPDATGHSPNPSEENLYGAVGLAPWAALQAGVERPRYHAALVDAMLGAERNAAVDSPPDIVLAVLMGQLHHRHRYGALARERYDAKVAAAGGVYELGASVRDARHAGAADGLIAYDLGWFALAAMSLHQTFPRAGYDADADQFVSLVVSDLDATEPSFDYRDSREAFYVQGLAWSTLLASWSDSSGALFDDLRTRLLEIQLPNGGWPYNADYPDAHLQATAHALMALGMLSHRDSAPHSVSHAAASWLMSQQATNGGWAYTAEQEYPILDAEIALSLSLAESRGPQLLPVMETRNGGAESGCLDQAAPSASD